MFGNRSNPGLGSGNLVVAGKSEQGSKLPSPGFLQISDSLVGSWGKRPALIRHLQRCRASDSGYLLVRDEFQDVSIDAIALVAGWRSVMKEVAEMNAGACATYFNPFHAV